MQLSLKINTTFSLFYCCNKLALAMTVRSIVHTTPPDHVNQREQSALKLQQAASTVMLHTFAPTTDLPVSLQMFTHRNSFFDQMVQVLGQVWCETFRFQNAQNLVSRDETNLRNTHDVTRRTCETHTTSRGEPAKHTRRHEANLRNTHDDTKRTCETHECFLQRSTITHTAAKGKKELNIV